MARNYGKMTGLLNTNQKLAATNVLSVNALIFSQLGLWFLFLV